MAIKRRLFRRNCACVGCVCLLVLAAAGVAMAPHARDYLVRRSRIRPEIPTTRRAEPDVPLIDLARAAGIGVEPIADARIVVDKSDLELRFCSGETLLKTYPIALGSTDLSDKRQRGDRLTPEGEFTVCQRDMHRDPQAWSDVWMRLDYPLPEDADRGLEAGIIDESRHRAIQAAHAASETPPQDTDLGSGIGIHIGGVGEPDWTLGCVALERDHGIEIYEQTRLGTPVLIQP